MTEERCSSYKLLLSYMTALFFQIFQVVQPIMQVCSPLGRTYMLGVFLQALHKLFPHDQNGNIAPKQCFQNVFVSSAKQTPYGFSQVITISGQGKSQRVQTNKSYYVNSSLHSIVKTHLTFSFQSVYYVCISTLRIRAL